MSTQFPTSPYFDDFSADKNFYKMLFRPGYALQTRELNQLQSMLQSQTEAMSNHLFKDGAMVIPGYISQDLNCDCIKLETSNSAAEKVSLFLSEFIDTIITGAVSGAQALVIHTETEIGTDKNTLYFKYIKSGDVSAVFTDGEIITNNSATPLTCTTIASSSNDVGSLATIQQGIYYIKGYFVTVAKETIVLDKYGTTPSYKVGLNITEDIITPDDDETLNDNAIGTYNYYAPGAHRYKISTNLVKLPLDSTLDSSFLELLRTNVGTIEAKVTKTDYSVLEESLARRTYDESGDYTVTPFKLQIREDRSNDRDVRVNSTAYIIGDIIEYTTGGITYTYECIVGGTSALTVPTYIYTFGTFTDGTVTWSYTETPVYNLGINLPPLGDESKFDIILGGGKAYVKGYELEKLGTTNVTVDKPRDFERVNSSNITVNAGNFIRINNIHSIPEIPFATISLYDRVNASHGTAAGTLVGTAMVGGIEIDGVIANTYKLFLFNIVLVAGKTFNKDVRGLFYNNTTLAENFTANVYQTNTLLTGSISAATDPTVVGVGTRFTSQLVAGDYITTDGATYYCVSSVTTDLALELTGNATITGSAFYRASSTIYEPNAIASTIPFSNNYIRNVKSADDISNDTSYVITRNFQAKSSSGSGVIVITLTVAGETFASSANATNYLFVNNSTGAPIVPTVVISGAGKLMTATGLANSIAYNVSTSVTKTAAQRSKTLNLGTIDAITSAAVHSAKITLAKADCYELVSVKLAPAFGTINGGNLATIDITNNFNFDTGQRNTHYDVGSISLKPGYFPPNGSIKIVFQYFTHGAGDYFSVDSYSNVIPYNAINYDLRDFLDFRPVMNDGGTAFDGSNDGILKRGYDLSCDYSYYLNRIDILSIDKLGNFFITQGVSSLTPIMPNMNKQAMNIAIITMLPYGIDTTSNCISLEVIENKRYTMRDIGALEKRISNVEYYTSLSLLEQETKSLSIPDESGFERYKNGFIVDSFSDHGVGDINSLDYKCSIDITAKELRPQHNVKNIELIEKDVNSAQRIADNYVITGDLITLPYTTKELIKQPFASRVKNINPFAIFTFLGSTKFTPASDSWFEDTYAPDVVVNKEGNYLSTIDTLKVAGVLGTVWKSWQTTWTGVKSTKKFSGFTTERVKGQPYPFRKANFTTETVTTTKETRKGINTQVVAKFDTEEVDDKVISTAVIPYMRQRNILFLARGLKPNTIFYPFFDSKLISAYITPASKLTIAPVAGYNMVFDSTTNVGGTIIEAARLVNNKVDSSLSNGDVIIGRSSGATAVVALQENSATGAVSIYIVNVKGTFLANEIIDASISTARATISAIDLKTIGNSLLSNFNGDIVGIFNIPNNDKIRFNTGEREFTLTTQPLNTPDYSSIVRGMFSSNGVLQTRQKTIESVRNATIVQNTVSQNKTVISTNGKIDNIWYDPLAQTFQFQQNGGAFLTKVDVYFGSKDTNIPVRMQIRDVVNGYPGKTILPFSEVTLTPDKVLLSNIRVIAPDGNTTDRSYYKDDIATSFVFPSPVYVQQNVDYCIVLLSDSNNYTAWISQLGEKQIGSDNYISKQPYAGVLFESQNASTWTANQLQDLKFTIHSAVFTTNVAGNVTFVNSIIPTQVLESDSLQTTSGSKVVRVWNYNHGMINGDTITMSGITVTSNNIPAAELNGNHVIANVDLDSYTITVATTNANVTGFTGGTTITVTNNVKYDSIEPTIQTLEFPEATITYDIKTTSTASALDSVASNIPIGDTLDMSSSKIIASQINETTNMSGNKSLTISARLITTNDAVSPIIDSQKKSAVCISNRINEPSISLNVNPIDYRVLHAGASDLINTVADATGYYFTTANAPLMLIFTSVMAGKYITVTNCTTSGNNGVKLVTGVAADGSYIKVADVITNADVSTTIAISIGDNYINEIAPINSSSSSKYVSKMVSLELMSTSFKLMFAYSKPYEANIDVYYRIGSNSALNELNNSIYTLVTNSGLVSTSDINSYTDATYELSALPAFTAIQVKLVMRSTDTSKVPKMKDLRIIALA